MRKILAILILLILSNPVGAFGWNSQEKAVKNVIVKQFKYANKCNFDKFISTFDKEYVNSDGFDLDIYSELVKDIWSTYENIRYSVKIKNVSVNGDSAEINVTEFTNADLPLTKNYTGELDSVSESTYYLKNNNGKWKVVSDSVSDETTRMLYGQAKNLDVKLTVPKIVEADTEYTASLEFVPPKNMLAVASIAADKVVYPQPKTKEVFRAMPKDNILERLFTSNSDNVNEYVIASIGLTQTDIKDLSIKMSLTGFGYVIKRVNVVPVKDEKENSNDKN